MDIRHYSPLEHPYSTKIHNRMARALKVALLSTEKQRHGAVLMQSGRVLGLGVNSYKNTPRSVSKEHIGKISIHAEVAACRSHLDVPDTVLYLARVGRNYEGFAYSKPCPECIHWLMWNTSVKIVYHS